MLTVSDTAYAIARVRAEESARDPAARLFDDPYAAIFDAAGDHAREGTERFLSLPYFRDGIRLRTRFFDDFVREGVAAGVSQLVLMGAGFDMRAMRLPEVAAHGASAFEVDFGDLLATRRALLAAAGVTPPPWDHDVACDFEAADFESTLSEGLVARGFRVGRGALFVWEGVVTYLTQEAIDRSLGVMARVGGVGSRVAFDFGAYSPDPEPWSARVRRLGYSAFVELGHDTLWRRHLTGEPHDAASIVRVAVATV